MISLYADEDVDVLVKPLLKAKGITVYTTLDERMLGKTDREQLEHATRLKAAFLTHNRVDFEKLAAQFLAEGKEHFGIVLATRRNVYELARRAARFLEMHKPGGVKNGVWYI